MSWHQAEISSELTPVLEHAGISDAAVSAVAVSGPCLRRAGDCGSIAPSGTLEVAPGSDMTIMISADAGFTIDDVIVDAASKGTVQLYLYRHDS